MTTPLKFSPGDPVRDLRCDVIPGMFRELRGEWATVRWEGKIVDSDVHVDNLRHETEAERTEREQREAHRAWCAKQPTSRHVGVRWNNAAVYLSDMSNPDEMRTATAELLKLADWFAERPKQ